MREDVGKPCERMWGRGLAIGLIVVDLSKERWLWRTN